MLRWFAFGRGIIIICQRHGGSSAGIILEKKNIAHPHTNVRRCPNPTAAAALFRKHHAAEEPLQSLGQRGESSGALLCKLVVVAVKLSLIDATITTEWFFQHHTYTYLADKDF